MRPLSRRPEFAGATAAGLLDLRSTSRAARALAGAHQSEMMENLASLAGRPCKQSDFLTLAPQRACCIIASANCFQRPRANGPAAVGCHRIGAEQVNWLSCCALGAAGWREGVTK